MSASSDEAVDEEDSREEEDEEYEEEEGQTSEQKEELEVFEVIENAVFGEVEFSGLLNVAKFVRLPSTASADDIQNTLTKNWKLKERPPLIINIFGGQFEKDKKLRDIFKVALWKPAISAGCWVVTEGFNYGVMKLTGEAVREYLDAYGPGRILNIGVCSWGCISRRDILMPSTEEGGQASKYELEEVDARLHRFRPTDEEESLLDPNHTNFFLVDTGVAFKKGLTTEFWTRFGSAISNWKDEDNEDVKVPMCGLLIGGDRFTLEQVFFALKENKCPIVTAKGTFGAADLLALAVEEVQGGKEELSERDLRRMGISADETDDERFLRRVRDACVMFLPCRDYFDYQKEIEMLQIITKDYINLVQVFDMEEDRDLDGKMISALLSSDQADEETDELNLNQLKICVTLNRSDIAREKILVESKKWKNWQLSEFMCQALLENKCDFVNLFLDEGFSLEDFLSVSVLQKLYTDQIKKTNSKLAIFIDLLTDHTTHKKKSTVRLKNVGKVIRALVGDFYNPYYLSVDFLEEFSHNTEHPDAPKLPRPARELMIWSVLMGKMEMAKLFWSKEKEPISAALLASILIKSIRKLSDDHTDKEEFEEAYMMFEDECAVGVMGECYAEDEDRAQLLVNRELSFYGNTSCINLAGEGECRTFVAHNCCQDFLNKIWMGRLSKKNGILRFTLGIVCGLIFPLLLFKVMLFRHPDIDEEAEKAEGEDEKEGQENAALNREDEEPHVYENPDEEYENGKVKKKDGINTEDVTINLESLGEPSKKKQKTKKTSEAVEHTSDEVFKPKTLAQKISCIKHFYKAPVIRFVYNSMSYLAFIAIFSYILLYEMDYDISAAEYVLLVYVVTLLLEEVKQATLNGISFSTYISDNWNKLDCVAVGLFVLGFVLRLSSLLQDSPREISMGLNTFMYHVIVYDDLFVAARCCYCFSLFAFYMRLLNIFSFHSTLGPMQIMIGRMVIQNLVPFMLMLLVATVGYGVAYHSIAYPTGLYSPPVEFTGKYPDKMTRSYVIFNFLTKSFYQMFGDFGLDTIRGQDLDCQNDGMCPHWAAIWIVPIMLAFYVLFTNVLLFNLLIAEFADTYTKIIDASHFHYNFQRYSMISEFITRSPLAPPLIVIWHMYEFALYVKLKCQGKSIGAIIDPLNISYKDSQEKMKKERALMNWENLKATDFRRHESELKESEGRGSSKVIVRAGGAAGQGQPAPGSAADFQKQMQDVNSGIGLELEKRFKEVDTQINNMTNEFDERLNQQAQVLDKVVLIIEELKNGQIEMMERLNNPPPQSIPADIPDLEDKIREVISGIYETKPVWFAEASKQAASEAVSATPVAVQDFGASVIDEIRAAKATIESESEEEIVPEAPRAKVVEYKNSGHKVWRTLPFNFEEFTRNLRKLEAEKIPWTREYRGYAPLDASKEVPNFPSQDAHDAENKPLRSIDFNKFDKSSHLMRKSLLGVYRLDHASGAPLNPMGRTGVKGKGVLPHWGPNHFIVIIITRLARTNSGTVQRRLGQPVLEVLVLERRQQVSLPWFKVNHTSDCKYSECSKAVAKDFINEQLRKYESRRHRKKEMEALEKSKSQTVYQGYLEDQLNADNAWVETIVLNYHESEEQKYSDVLLKAFSEQGSEENIKWIEATHSASLRASHCELLKIVASHHNAYF